MGTSMNITNLPSDVLAEIAFAFVSTDPTLHATETLAAFISTARFAYNSLSLSANPALYSRLFKHFFDQQLVTARLERPIDGHAYSNELILRCRALRAFRSGVGSTTQSARIESEELEQYLWAVYLMVLEDEGKNIVHLKEFANLGEWITTYLFSNTGRSMLAQALLRKAWPLARSSIRLAIWLLWFIVDAKELTEANEEILKIFAHGAHQYDLSDTPWHSFSFGYSSLVVQTEIEHYGHKLVVSIPSLVAPSTLALIVSQRATSGRIAQTPLSMPCDRDYSHFHSTEKDVHQPHQWEAEWFRSTCFGRPAWIGGCMDGGWEGSFMFMDFNAFSQLRHGAAPPVLQGAMVAINEQYWALQEYHLFKPEDGSTTPARLPPSDVLAGFIPRGTQFIEKDGVLSIQEPGKSISTEYIRWDSRHLGRKSVDVIILGAGHSNWGRFTLRGRVRMGDGLVTFDKEYTEGPRGSWLYRGYVVGHPDGNFVGRWRDTITPVMDSGYEGCFALTRRK